MESKIRKALEMCSSYENEDFEICFKCPYYDYSESCIQLLMRDVKSLLNDLDEKVHGIDSKDITANQYQIEAMKTASGMNHENYGLLVNGVMGLCGESGEVIDIVKKMQFQGHNLDKKKLKEELGDVAWYLAICCEAIGVSLGDVMLGNVEKLRRRYPNGFEISRSVNRDEES